jgi:hypothetical protein
MTKQFKNYVGFADDHSGSMGTLANAAIRDSNANTQAIREAASREMLDTIVSAVDFGSKVTRRIVNSNPHVLKPVTQWPVAGMTAMYDAIGDLITLFESLPDANEPHVSFLIMVTTDGQENQSVRWNRSMLARKIAELQQTERWTFVFRVPRGARGYLEGLNIYPGNIQEWDTTDAGMAQSTVQTKTAIDTFYATRAAGKRGSNVFYADAQSVTAQTVQATLTDVSKEVSIWGVLPTEDGEEIQPWAMKRLAGAPFLKGAAFYQLTKTEARVQDGKLIAIRDKANGKVYSGDAARQLLNMPVRSPKGYVRLHPDATPQFDIFIQSTSINRKLVAGTSVLYWPAKGTGFTAADFPWLANGQAKPDDALTQRAVALVGQSAVAAVQATAPASSPVKLALAAALQRKFFTTRDEGRDHARKTGKVLRDAGPTAPRNLRWYVI